MVIKSHVYFNWNINKTFDYKVFEFWTLLKPCLHAAFFCCYLKKCVVTKSTQRIILLINKTAAQKSGVFRSHPASLFRDSFVTMQLIDLSRVWLIELFHYRFVIKVPLFVRFIYLIFTVIIFSYTSTVSRFLWICSHVLIFLYFFQT